MIKQQKEVKDATTEAYRRAELEEAKVEHPKGALIKVEADLSSKKGRRVVEAKQKIAKAKKKAKKRSTEAGT